MTYLKSMEIALITLKEAKTRSQKHTDTHTHTLFRRNAKIGGFFFIQLISPGNSKSGNSMDGFFYAMLVQKLFEDSRAYTTTGACDRVVKSKCRPYFCALNILH
jgi:hypothetical protein